MACLNDDSIGPSVRGCRADFDFTVKFERIFLSIIPASVFVALALTRVVYLATRPRIVGAPLFQYAKSGVIVAYAALHLSLLVLTTSDAVAIAQLSISSAALNLPAALCIVVLSFLEHSRAPRPSILLNAYLLVTLLFDIAQTRTLWLSAVTKHEDLICRVFTASTAVKCLLLLLESQQKTRWLTWRNKEHSPEESSGIYSLGAFFWLNDLFLRGYRKVLKMKDLYPLDQNVATETLQTSFATNLEGSGWKDDKYGLMKVVGKTLAVPLLLPVAPRIAKSGFMFSQPFLIEALLQHLEQVENSSSRNVGYGLIGATVLTYAGIAFSTALYWYFQERALFMARGCLASAVYKKTTESKLSSADDSAALTLMSTDTERVRTGLLHMHELWANTVEAALASWLLYRKIGAAFAAPIVVVLLSVFASAFTGRYIGTRQKAWMAIIQTRVGLTSSVIANMKYLKISGLTVPVGKLIQSLRVKELDIGGRYRMMLIMTCTIAYVPQFLSPVFTFAVTSKSLDVTTIFTSMSYLILLANPLSTLFQCIPGFLAGVACFSRIQDFLLKDPRFDFRRTPEKVLIPASDSDEGGVRPAITVTQGSFGWQGGEHNVRNIDVQIPASRLTIVIGPVASGKSTLCKAILGETPTASGKVEFRSSNRKIGYCDQSPFLSNATIQENIIGFSEYDAARYNDAIEATMLRMDFSTLPSGDQTKIGSNGITLSGGQKQRVSMARALYLQTDLLIFDDILSGLDADTEEAVFFKTFGPQGILKKRKATVVLCTHSVRYLPTADHIIALDRTGSLVEQGTFTELVAKKSYVHSLGVKISNSSSSSVKSQDEVKDEVEDSRALTKTTTVYSAISDTEDPARQIGDRKVYSHYVRTIGWMPMILFTLSGLGWGFFSNFNTVWLTFWSNDMASARPKHSNSYYIGLYALFQVLVLTSLFFTLLVGLGIMIKFAGAALHKSAIETVINAPLRFFTTTDTGIVTNLFSQDMTLIDGQLPMAYTNVGLDIFASLGAAGVIATSSSYMAAIYPALILVLYLIQRFYLRTSRQLRLLDLEAKSPLYSHFIDTMRGLSTFRAFGWVDHGIKLNNQLVDTSQRPAYLLSMIQRWLALMLNLVVAVMAVVLVTLATQLRSQSGFTGASMVTIMQFGEILTNIVQMYTQLETSIGAVARLKSFSERTKPECLPDEDLNPDDSWPLAGRISIKGVSASYGTEDALQDPAAPPDLAAPPATPLTTPHLALRDLDITIEAGEKVAICGRTGSGKSSVLLLLLRLLDPVPSCAQNIEFDGVPLHRVDRSTLRRRVIAVPQDAVFLPDGSSFQANLDPSEASAAAECRAVLESVGLWAFVAARGGLAGAMASDSLSQGQKQLFSLARAILRRRVRAKVLRGEKEGGILLLDEVSSSVDRDTDRAMQAVIREEFAAYTIVMVSHRLDVVMDFDRVIVMDKGCVIEDGEPRELVTREGSRFGELWALQNNSRKYAT